MRPRRFHPASVTRSAFAGFCFPPDVIVLACAGTCALRCRIATSKSLKGALRRSCSSPVLVQETTEQITSAHHSLPVLDGAGWIWINA